MFDAVSKAGISLFELMSASAGCGHAMTAPTVVSWFGISVPDAPAQTLQRQNRKEKANSGEPSLELPLGTFPCSVQRGALGLWP